MNPFLSGSYVHWRRQCIEARIFSPSFFSCLVYARHYVCRRAHMLKILGMTATAKAHKAASSEDTGQHFCCCSLLTVFGQGLVFVYLGLINAGM